MKHSSFEKLAIELIKLIPSDRFLVEYKYNMIFIGHFNETYVNRFKGFYIFHDIDSQNTILNKFEQAKKILKGDKLIDE
ncbi:hypothetical protein [Staphylococcus epidermidis]|uniref:hypothetical protein n=1 Tax=Staphylococcus epidermidis TaxID=1282 RepID=UPI00053A8234|nr:hypothetical protein [Staphylococcus epidermidis]APT16509.1 hypothetical protein BUM85_06180 [Staphylococcus epidermidis]